LCPLGPIMSQKIREFQNCVRGCTEIHIASVFLREATPPLWRASVRQGSARPAVMGTKERRPAMMSIGPKTRESQKHPEPGRSGNRQSIPAKYLTKHLF